MDQVMNVQLLEPEWGKKVALSCLRVVSKTHFVSPIGAKSVDLTLNCQGEGVAIAKANLDDIVEDFLDSGWLVDDELIFKDAVSETKLALAIVSESVKLARPGDQGRAVIATFDVCNRVRSLEIELLRAKNG